MNYLAHLVLSGADAEMRTGGFLGDWLKGPLHLHRKQWPTNVIAGLQRHRQIDVWIDRQPETEAAIAALGPRFRRLAGPVIDIAFDHFLSQQFERWHDRSLPEFCAEVFEQLARFQQQMPAGAQRFLSRAQSHRLFERYAEQDTFYAVVASLRNRVSRPELLDGVESALAERHAELGELFARVYPRALNYIAHLESR